MAGVQKWRHFLHSQGRSVSECRVVVSRKLRRPTGGGNRYGTLSNCRSKGATPTVGICTVRLYPIVYCPRHVLLYLARENKATRALETNIALQTKVYSNESGRGVRKYGTVVYSTVHSLFCEGPLCSLPTPTHDRGRWPVNMLATKPRR